MGCTQSQEEKEPAQERWTQRLYKKVEELCVFSVVLEAWFSKFVEGILLQPWAKPYAKP